MGEREKAGERLHTHLCGIRQIVGKATPKVVGDVKSIMTLDFDTHKQAHTQTHKELRSHTYIPVGVTITEGRRKGEKRQSIKK